MKRNLGRLTFALSALCGITLAGHASAEQTLFEAANNLPIGFLSSQERMASEGGSSGGGGDALFLNREALQNAVTVSVPDELQFSATLLVTGVPGPNQPKKFKYIWYKNLEKSSPHYILEGALNEPVKLRPGYIGQIEYSHTQLSYSVSMPIKVDPNAQLTYELKNIEVPKVDSTFKYEVYIDYSDEKNRFIPNIQLPTVNTRKRVLMTPSMKRIDLRDTSNKSGVMDFLDAIISGDIKSSPDVQSMAKQLETYVNSPSQSNLPNLAGPNGGILGSYDVACEGFLIADMLLGPTDYGTITECKDRSKKGEIFTFVTDPYDGDTVSVFPGTYGIKFTASDGRVSYVHGIQVK